MDAYALGEALTYLWSSHTKQAGDAALSYAMQGELYLSSSGWLLLRVPNALGIGAFRAMTLPGIQLPTQGNTGKYNAHISVMRPEEVEAAGGPDAIKERGHMFSYTLGPLREVIPAGWSEMAKAWIIEVRSPALLELRRTYNLGPPKYKFHITVAVKPKQKRKSFVHKEAATRTAIRKSPIDGKGLFATRAFEPGDVILPQAMTVMRGIADRKRYEQSEEARYTNHSDSPNSELEAGDNYVKLVASRPIAVNEEITADYNLCDSVLGDDYYFTYQGKEYNGESSSAVNRNQKEAKRRLPQLAPLPPIRETSNPLLMLERTATRAKLARLCQQSDLLEWQQVPELVTSRYKEASQVKRTLQKVLKHLPKTADPGYGQVYWNPETKDVWAVMSDNDTEQTTQRWYNALKSVMGVNTVHIESEAIPHDDDWILLEKAASPYDWAGKLTGGPSPLSNAIVSGLLGAGGGYVAGTVAEKLMPERFFDRGRLRKNLALLGGLAGAGLHVPAAVTNASINQSATGEPHWLRSITKGDAHQYRSPTELDLPKRMGLVKQNAAVLTKLHEDCDRLSAAASPELQEAAQLFFKLARTGYAGSAEVALRPVPVDAFNRAIWNDVHNGLRSSRNTAYGTRSMHSDNSENMHTPPAVGAAASGLVSGIQSMYGNRSVLSPRHFITGLASAGVDMATARVAGGVLGVLGGMTPEGQKKLQDIGLWSGMIRGATGSVLGF